jgi:hypothetical protein
MSIEEDIRSALLAMTAVADFNGSGSGDEIVIRYGYLEEDDTSTQPHIVLDVNSDAPLNALDGLGGLRMAELTLTCRATTMANAKALAEAVRTNGTTPGTGLGGYGGSGAAFDAWLEEEVRAVEPFDDNSGRVWHATIQTYMVQYTENV